MTTPLRMAMAIYSGMTLDQAVSCFRRDFLQTALRLNGWNQVRTAKAIGVHRNTLCRHLHELGIDAHALKRNERRMAADRMIGGHAVSQECAA